MSFIINFVVNLFFFFVMIIRVVVELSVDVRKIGREREWMCVYNKVESEKDVFIYFEVF